MEHWLICQDIAVLFVQLLLIILHQAQSTDCTDVFSLSRWHLQKTNKQQNKNILKHLYLELIEHANTLRHTVILTLQSHCLAIISGQLHREQSASTEACRTAFWQVFFPLYRSRLWISYWHLSVSALPVSRTPAWVRFLLTDPIHIRACRCAAGTE